MYGQGKLGLCNDSAMIFLRVVPDHRRSSIVWQSGAAHFFESRPMYLAGPRVHQAKQLYMTPGEPWCQSGIRMDYLEILKKARCKSDKIEEIFVGFYSKLTRPLHAVPMCFKEKKSIIGSTFWRPEGWSAYFWTAVSSSVSSSHQEKVKLAVDRRLST